MEEPSFTESINSYSSMDQLRAQINDLIQEISYQPNVFLQKQLKCFMQSLSQNPQLKPFKFFPNQFQERINSLQSILRDSDMVTSQALRYIRQRFASIELAQLSQNEAANALLDTTLAKSLPLNLSKKLIKLIETTIRDEQIVAFLKERWEQGANQKQFLQEIKKKKIKGGRNVPNLKTLTDCIVKMRPKEKPVLERLLKQRQNYKSFEHQIIEVTSQNLQETVNGKIVRASYKQDVYQFVLKRFQNSLLMEIHLGVDSIQKILVEEQRLQPLRKIIDEIIKLKEANTTYDKIVSIRHNTNFFSNSTVLPEGDYKIRLQFTSDKNWKLGFVTHTRRPTHRNFILYLEKNQICKLKYMQKNQFYTYDEFLNCYFVKIKINKEFTFMNRQSIPRCVKIYKSYFQDNREFIEKLQRIQKKKQGLIGKFLSLGKEQFNQLLEFFINSSIFSKDQLKKFNINDDIQNIIQLTKQLGSQLEIQDLMYELLNKVNYTNLVNKNSTLSTIRAVQLFTSSESFTSTIKEKDIITFYGNTGSGKSTSVNYLIGVPLETANNRFGDSIVKVKTQETQGQMPNDRCSKIGQSNGLSQTLFTRGYNILDIKQNQKQIYENIVLCDNPGFRDTRGTQYEICTNLSMDRAIQVCKSIKAIVLIVPYQAIMLDKGTPLLQLMFEMEDRFPNLFDKESPVFQHFYLLITKTTNSEQNVETIYCRFSAILEQLQNHYISNNNNYNRSQRYQLASKIHVYQTLCLMFQNSQIDVISINNQLDRQDLLHKYVQNSGSISPSQYKKTMTNDNLMIKFLNEISTSAHSWSKLILQPYNKSIVEQFKQFEKNLDLKIKQLQQTQNNIAGLQREAVKLQEYEKAKEHQAAEINNEIKHMESIEKDKISQYINQSCYKIQESDVIQEPPEYVFDYKERLEGCRQKLHKLQQVAKELQNSKRFLSQSFSAHSGKILTLSYNSQNLKNKIQNWKKGEVQQIVYLRKYKIGSIVCVGSTSLSKNQRLEYVNRGQLINRSQTSKQFKSGQLNIKLFSIVKISKDYSLLPNKQFDPNQYISKSCSAFGRYKAVIESRKTILQAAKLFEQGKQLFLSILKEFIVTDKQSELPLLKITHFIPSQEHNTDLIRNADAEIRAHNQEISKFQEEILIMKNKIQDIQREMNICEIQKKEYKLKHEQLWRQNQEARVNLIKQKKAIKQQEKFQLLLGNKKKQLHNIQNIIKTTDQQIKKTKSNQDRAREKKVKCQDELAKIELNKNQLKFRHKRFALLIRDQLNKKIPQTLADFIQIAKQMMRQTVEKKLIKEQDIILKIENLDYFLEQYGKVKDTIEEQVNKHLNTK